MVGVMGRILVHKDLDHTVALVLNVQIDCYLLA